MSEENKMEVLSWIPQVKSNNISIESTNRMKPRLLTTLKLDIYQQKKIILKEWWCISKILEPHSLSIVNNDMNDQGITQTNLPFLV